MMKKQTLLIFLLSATFSGLSGKYKQNTAGIRFVKNELNTKVTVFRSEDKKSWEIAPNSKREITQWVPWCNSGKMQIKIDGKVILSFGERDARWVRDCKKSKPLFKGKVKIGWTTGAYNLKIMGTRENPKFEFYTFADTNFENKLK